MLVFALTQPSNAFMSVYGVEATIIQESWNAEFMLHQFTLFKSSGPAGESLRAVGGLPFGGSVGALLMCMTLTL